MKSEKKLQLAAKNQCANFNASTNKCVFDCCCAIYQNKTCRYFEACILPKLGKEEQTYYTQRKTLSNQQKIKQILDSSYETKISYEFYQLTVKR